MAKPLPVQPIYTTPEPNETIVLADGEHVEILFDGVKKESKANVSLRFLPKPELVIESTLPDTSAVPNKIKYAHGIMDATNVTAHFPLWTLKTKVLVKNVIPTGKGLHVILSPNPQVMNISNLSTPDLRKVVFHLPNFKEFFGTTNCILTNESKNSSYRLGCVELVADGWQITINAIPSTKSSVTTLREAGGFAITHVGKIELENKETFTKEQAEDILQCLANFLSFASGFRTPPLLTTGFDTQGRPVWKQWGVRPIDQWQPVCSWFDEHHAELLVELFPGFLRRWKSNIWKESLKEVIHWYLMGNMQAGGLEGAIILTQAALELLAWVYSVEDRRLKSQNGFEGLQASDRLRLLLSSLDIPCEIPGQLIKLKTAKGSNWKDAPEAFTKLRNSIVHSNRKKRKKISGMKYEGWQLGLWHVELTLLRLFSHNGNYRNRLLTGQWVGRVEKVPWAT